MEEFVRGMNVQPEKTEPAIIELPTTFARGQAPLKIFLSHSVKDKSLADRLAEDLRAAGAEVWYDSDEINVGDSILEKIEQGAKSDFMVLILSPESVISWMVKQEMVMFLNEEGAAASLP